jgi:hypothetical protein
MSTTEATLAVLRNDMVTALEIMLVKARESLEEAEQQRAHVLTLY